MYINPTHKPAVSTSQIQKNIASAQGNNQTVIQSTNDLESTAEKMMKILDEKYRKINEQNKKYKDPHGHIFDKYRNPHSSHFRSDLTKKERDAAYSMEIGWANSGQGGQYNFNDAAFRHEAGYNPEQEGIERRVFNRQQVNDQLRELFSMHGITIPNGTNLTFTIDPNDFNLIIGGSEDETLIKQLESILNTANNPRELFFHIMKSRSHDSNQFSNAKLEKFHLVNQIKTVTGYNLKDLEIANGKFLTNDGTDIFDIYKENLKQNPYTKNHVGEALGYYGPLLHELAEHGFDSIPDLTLSILYKSHQLQDIGQSVNYSEI
ncbi:DUF4885 family protein [Jeotgalibacillus sp. R-1-5s-1]|uniref:DUF4885 family protein n=1 Tax=Jeotgalibacillus sp. R-1-5s-1 TaxID=2555897 RepID=UPI00106D4730|nr:DUF4885 family protein [Jeotgalibacillus sp. R-1-5s-1]TFD94349.1 DUF4885 domain-containing protein [Jeotgalibacillus sp. R-1-5s-1]